MFPSGSFRHNGVLSVWQLVHSVGFSGELLRRCCVSKATEAALLARPNDNFLSSRARSRWLCNELVRFSFLGLAVYGWTWAAESDSKGSFLMASTLTGGLAVQSGSTSARALTELGGESFMDSGVISSWSSAFFCFRGTLTAASMWEPRTSSTERGSNKSSALWWSSGVGVVVTNSSEVCLAWDWATSFRNWRFSTRGCNAKSFFACVKRSMMDGAAAKAACERLLGLLIRENGV